MAIFKFPLTPKSSGGFFNSPVMVLKEHVNSYTVTISPDALVRSASSSISQNWAKELTKEKKKNVI